MRLAKALETAAAARRPRVSVVARGSWVRLWCDAGPPRDPWDSLGQPRDARQITTLALVQPYAGRWIRRADLMDPARATDAEVHAAARTAVADLLGEPDRPRSTAVPHDPGQAAATLADLGITATRTGSRLSMPLPGVPLGRAHLDEGGWISTEQRWPGPSGASQRQAIAELVFRGAAAFLGPRPRADDGGTSIHWELRLDFERCPASLPNALHALAHVRLRLDRELRAMADPRIAVAYLDSRRGQMPRLDPNPRRGGRTRCPVNTVPGC